jgi:hypothetical protein
MTPSPFPVDRASLLRAVRQFLGALNARVGKHEDVDGDGCRTVLPNGIDFDDLVVGLLAQAARTPAAALKDLLQLPELPQPQLGLSLSPTDYDSELTPRSEVSKPMSSLYSSRDSGNGCPLSNNSAISAESKCEYPPIATSTLQQDLAGTRLTSM